MKNTREELVQFSSADGALKMVMASRTEEELLSIPWRSKCPGEGSQPLQSHSHLKTNPMVGNKPF